MNYRRYTSLGNDYIVLDPDEVGALPSADQIRRICDRNFGVGSDGILWGPLASQEKWGARHVDAKLRIFNPDGSEAEKSGNGIRIFTRFFKEKQQSPRNTFVFETLGGIVESHVDERESRSITVDMGQVSFNAKDIPVNGFSGEVLRKEIRLSDRAFEFCAATIGNPHCVIILPEISAELARKFGPQIERHHFFPNRTNVQFVQVSSTSEIKIEIWERGAGYTLASGSSSSAAAAVCNRLKLVGDEVTVKMPGGDIWVKIGENYSVQQTGLTVYIGEGTISEEVLNPQASRSAANAPAVTSVVA
ncbi:MAG TPA: diaminopimelate epimerase [Opitutaceae bacterium]|nr:diaminopimelate epimerase [Opitutaceae bacterium]